jgi:acetate---CoA ligase (ADP-forming)
MTTRAANTAPVELEDPRVVLRDGTVATLRLTQPSDHHALRRFFHDLCPESRARRFFTLSEPAETLIDTFCDSSAPARQVTMVALRQVGGELRPVAVGSYLDLRSGIAEAAFAVADAFHGKGLGTILVERLAAIAAANGFRTFEATVLPDNHAMLEVFRPHNSGLPLRR